MRFVGQRYRDAELAEIDAGHRAGFARCPIDGKPLLSTAWSDKTTDMVYFVCRECARIGAIAYLRDSPGAPGLMARHSASSRPPPR